MRVAVRGSRQLRSPLSRMKLGWRGARWIPGSGGAQQPLRVLQPQWQRMDDALAEHLVWHDAVLHCRVFKAASWDCGDMEQEEACMVLQYAHWALEHISPLKLAQRLSIQSS